MREMMEEGEVAGRREDSPPRIQNDALSQLRIENIWSESAEGESEGGAFGACSISVDPALFIDDDDEEGEDAEGPEEHGDPGVTGGDGGGGGSGLPELVIVEQQPTAPASLGRFHHVAAGGYPDYDDDDDDDDDDPLSTDHLQVEVIEIDSSDGAEEWSTGALPCTTEKKKQIKVSCNNGKTGDGDVYEATAAAALAVEEEEEEEEEEAKKEEGSEVDENSNSEWDFYSYLANMDVEDGAEGGGGGGGGAADAKRYVCYDCGFRTNRSDKFSRHVQTAHNDDNGGARKHNGRDTAEERDGEGNEAAGGEDEEELEEVVAEEEEMLECAKCDYRTRNRRHLRNHTRHRHHRGKGRPPAAAGAPPILKCGRCPFATRHRPLLTQHLKQAHGAAPPAATGAPSFTLTTTTPGTTQAAGEVKYHCCDRCPYKTKWKHHIKEHYMFHHNEGEIEWHKCPLCDYQTKWKYHIKQHLKAKHADGREAATFSCPVPGCRFQTKWKPHFQRHLRQEHGTGGGTAGGAGVRLLACPHCQYSTPNRSNLNTHVRARHGGGPAAGDAGAVAAAAATTGARPPDVHQCDKCGFRTRWKHHLKNHWIMKHQENAVLPVFRCSECSYESKWKHHVKIHKENKHTQLPCERCPFVAHTKLEMRQHVKTCHHHPHHRLLQHHAPHAGPRIVSVEGGARVERGGASVSGLLPPGLTYAWTPPPPQPPQVVHQQQQPLRCRLCGHVAPHRPALEHHLRQRHPAAAAGAGAMALQIPVLLRLPGHGADPGGQRPFHAGLGPLDRKSLNALGAPGGVLGNGARMQLPLMLRLPGEAGGAAGGPAAGLDLQSCFRMMSSLYARPPAPPPPAVSQGRAGGGGGSGGGEAPIVLLRCSDCPFQTASVDALKLHVVTRHRQHRQQHAHNGAAAAAACRENDGDDDDEEEEDDEEQEEHEEGVEEGRGSGAARGGGGGALRCRVCGYSCGRVEQLVRHSRDEHGRTLVVNGASVSLLPPEISVTPVQLAPRPQPQPH